jgi:hypothetical protein
MTKREALQYSSRYYDEQTRRERRWPLSKEFLVKRAIETAASELLGECVDNFAVMKDGLIYPVYKRPLRSGPAPRLRLVGVSRRYVTLETL